MSMRIFFLSLALFGISLNAAADTVVLKDGKIIEWKMLKDKGDSIELTTVQGSVMTLKKSDIEKIMLTDAAPLTGATLKFPGKVKSINLFGVIDPKRDAPKGKWRFSKNSLLCESDVDVPTLIELGCPIPEEYDLTVIVERKEGVDPLYIGLVARGSSFMLEVDANKSTITGLTLGSGPGAESNGTGVPGPILDIGKSRTITCYVRKDFVAVAVDNKEILRWKGSYEGLSLPLHACLPGKKTALFLGTYKMTAVQKCTFVVHRLTLSSPVN